MARSLDTYSCGAIIGEGALENKRVLTTGRRATNSRPFKFGKRMTAGYRSTNLRIPAIAQALVAA
jgi:hypothetical protein